MREEYEQNECLHTVTLAGGFTAALSNSERNEWHEHVRGLPAFEELCAADDQLSAALVVAGAGGAAGDDTKRLREEMAWRRELGRRVWDVAQEWFDELVIRRAAKAEEARLARELQDAERKNALQDCDTTNS